MAVDVMSVLNADSVATYIESLPEANTIGAQLFPVQKQMGIDITMIKGASNRPVALRQSQFDTDVRIRSLKASLVEETKEMPFFKEAVVLRERDRQNLLLAMQGGNEQWRDMILSQIYENITSLTEGAAIQVERMRMQLISEGKITVVSEDGDIELDYGLPTENKVTLSGQSLWSDHANSNPIEDIENWIQAMIDNGHGKPSRLILSRNVLRNIQKNNAIKYDISENGRAIITEAVALDYLRSKTNLQVALVDGTYLAEDGTEQLYYPQNMITLLPAGTLGKTFYGTTPEEADLMTGNAANVRTVNNVTITTVKKEDPVTVLTKVSQVVLPSCERIANVFIAQVLA